MTSYNKSLTFISLILMMGLCLITPALGAANCVGNPIATASSITTIGTPTAPTGTLQYCKSLQSSACCSAETINAFQTKANNLQAEIVAIVEKRDKLIVNNRDVEIPKIATKLADLKTKATSAETLLKTENDKGDSTFADGKALNLAQSLAIATALKTISTQATDGLATLKTGLETYQKARTTCMSELLRLQASAWCLACDPLYEDKGVETGSNPAINLDDTTCGRLEENCYAFVTGAVAQNNLILAQQLNAGIDKALSGLKDIADNKPAGLDDLITAVQSIEAGAKKSSDALSVQTPSGCTDKANCNWLCTSMFKTATGGLVDKDLAAQGGDLNKAITMPASGGSGSGSGSGSGRILLDGAGRSLLASSKWSPTADESGVTINFPQDPAKVNQSPSTGGENGGETKSAPKLVGGLFCLIMTLLGALLF